MTLLRPADERGRMQSRTIFITGATGLLGSHVAMKAIEADCSVRLLIRKQGPSSAEDRFRQIAEYFGYSHDQIEATLPQVDIVTGDITPPNFGRSQQEWAKATTGVDLVFHAAAFVEFDEESREGATRTNVDGTRHVVEFSNDAGAKLFHVSTAYVAGATQRMVGEDELIPDLAFKNVYEETKWQAEKYVHDTCQAKAIDYVVFRPAILVGRSTDGATFRYNNLFSFMKAFCLIRSRKDRTGRSMGAGVMDVWQKNRLHLPLRVEGLPEATKNLVPVDYAVDAMWRILKLDPPSGQTFHISNPTPITNTRLRDVFQELYNVDGLEYVRQEQFLEREPDVWEDALRKGTRNYLPYMFGEPRFDRTHTNRLLPDYDQNFPSLGNSFFARSLTYALQTRWGKTLPFNRKGTAPEGGKNHRYAHAYFTEFLPTKMDQQLIENLKTLNACFTITITNAPNDRWRIQIKEGRLVGLQNDTGPVECSFETSATAFRKVAEGRLSPQKAFFERQIEITGDIEKALKVAAALSQFFVAFPFFIHDKDPLSTLSRRQDAEVS